MIAAVEREKRNRSYTWPTAAPTVRLNSASSCLAHPEGADGDGRQVQGAHRRAVRHCRRAGQGRGRGVRWARRGLWGAGGRREGEALGGGFLILCLPRAGFLVPCLPVCNLALLAAVRHGLAPRAGLVT